MSISASIVADTLKEIVTKYGADHIYERPEGDRCAYTTPGGAPSCIVGHVIKRLRPEAFDTIAATEWTYDDEGEKPYPQDVNASSVESNYHVKLDFTQSAWDMLVDAQDRQDKGQPWGLVVESVGVKLD